MLTIRFRASLALATFLLCASAAVARDGVFIRAGQIDVRTMLAAPPADGSVQQKAELAELHRIERERTAAQVAAAKADDVEEDIFVYRTVLGPSFSAQSLPLTAELSRHVASNEPAVVNVGKDYFHRARPFDADKTLHNICAGTSGSFPSGHSTNGYLQALVLAAMVPERRDAILARANDYAYNRLVCGVHYASDLEASKVTAYAMYGLIANNPAFQAELVPAQNEVRKALGLHALP